MVDNIDIESDIDQQALEKHGLSVEEARRQWALLSDRPGNVVLDRPCTAGDGITQLPADMHAELIDLHRQAADASRWSKFVPASGAATRMFALQTDDDRQQFCESIRQFAFFDHLRERTSVDNLLNSQQYDTLIDAVMSATGLGYGDTPKGLITFHKYANETRTPFEEHLLESLTCLNDSNGNVRAHFTISPDHQDLFANKLRQFIEERSQSNLEVDFSVQFPSTDTIAMNGNGQLLRDDQGQPVFRPGGHGALLTNLDKRQADLVFVKNIDNVGHERARETTTAWIQILGGYLIQIQEEIHRHLHALEANDAEANEDDAVQSAVKFMQTTFPGTLLPTDGDMRQLQTILISQLNRPLRVCGMVKNEGEPGGGPFWVRASDGSKTIQIVESAEVDKQNSEQQAIFGQGTHFNPVFMALAVRDNHSQPFDLPQFVDPERAIITHKVVDGEKATVLEHPGLWNGAMANWNSLFVEVPKEVFTPVKTVFDLLRVEHQP